MAGRTGAISKTLRTVPAYREPHGSAPSVCRRGAGAWEVGAGLVMSVVGVAVEGHGRDVAGEHHGRKSVRKLSVGVMYVMGSLAQAVDELVGVWRDSLLDCLGILPCAWVLGS